MEIRIGKLWVNKTWKFLIPSLKGLGNDFTSKFNSVYKLAVGIHDDLVSESEISQEKAIFLLLDTSYQPQKVSTFLNYIRYQPYYVIDYCPDVDIINSRKRMAVIRIPKEYEKSYDHFLNSEFSSMYSQDQISFLFSDIIDKIPKTEREKDRRLTYEILTKTGKKALKNFYEELEREFGSIRNIESITNVEWSLPLKRKEEVFNYDSNDPRVFFHPELDKYGIPHI